LGGFSHAYVELGLTVDNFVVRSSLLCYNMAYHLDIEGGSSNRYATGKFGIRVQESLASHHQLPSLRRRTRFGIYTTLTIFGGAMAEPLQIPQTDPGEDIIATQPDTRVVTRGSHRRGLRALGASATAVATCAGLAACGLNQPRKSAETQPPSASSQPVHPRNTQPKDIPIRGAKVSAPSSFLNLCEPDTNITIPADMQEEDTMDCTTSVDKSNPVLKNSTKVYGFAEMTTDQHTQILDAVSVAVVSDKAKDGGSQFREFKQTFGPSESQQKIAEFGIGDFLSADQMKIHKNITRDANIGMVNLGGIDVVMSYRVNTEDFVSHEGKPVPGFADTYESQTVVWMGTGFDDLSHALSQGEYPETGKPPVDLN
jgi:hypothetical protein